MGLEANCAVNAGIIASRNGRATAVPAPLRNVLLERALRVNIIYLTGILLLAAPYRACIRSAHDLLATPRLERRALDDHLNESLEPVAIGAKCPIDIIHRLPVISLQTSAQSVSHHFFDQRPRELRQQ